VCILTGHGLKDPEWAIAGAAAPVSVPNDAAVVAAELELEG
jgi:threonine synthase